MNLKLKLRDSRNRPDSEGNPKFSDALAVGDVGDTSHIDFPGRSGVGQGFGVEFLRLGRYRNVRIF